MLRTGRRFRFMANWKYLATHRDACFLRLGGDLFLRHSRQRHSGPGTFPQLIVPRAGMVDGRKRRARRQLVRVSRYDSLGDRYSFSFSRKTHRSRTDWNRYRYSFRGASWILEAGVPARPTRSLHPLHTYSIKPLRSRVVALIDNERACR